MKCTQLAESTWTQHCTYLPTQPTAWLHANSWAWHRTAQLCTNTAFLHFRSLEDLLLSGNISVSISISRKLSWPLYGTVMVLFLGQGCILIVRMFSCMVVSLDGLNLNFQDLDILNPDGLLDHLMSRGASFRTTPYFHPILTLVWNRTINRRQCSCVPKYLEGKKVGL